MVLSEAHQANGSTDRRGESVKNIHRWIEPFCGCVIATPDLLKSRNFLLQHGKDSIRGIAGFEPAKEWI